MLATTLDGMHINSCALHYVLLHLWAEICSCHKPMHNPHLMWKVCLDSRWIFRQRKHMLSSESTQTSQKQDACGSNIFICDSSLQSFIFSGTQVAFCHKSLYSLTCLCRRMNLWGSPSAQGGSCTSPSTVPSCMQPAGITKDESKIRIRHTENRNNFIKTLKSKEIEVISPHTVSGSSNLVP